MQDPVPITLAAVPEPPMRVLICVPLCVGIVAYTLEAFGETMLILTSSSAWCHYKKCRVLDCYLHLRGQPSVPWWLQWSSMDECCVSTPRDRPGAT